MGGPPLSESAQNHHMSFPQRVLIVLVAWLIRALGATLRFEYDGGDAVTETLASGSAALIVGWHEFFLIACCDMRHLRPYIMVSQSRDGERITRVAERLGWNVVRGSSSRGGAKALLQMVRVLREPVLAGHLVDGPKGPRRQMKPGVILMAQRSQAVLIPSLYTVRHKWCVPSWDRLQVPYPFARVVRHDLPARCVSLHLTVEEANQLHEELQAELTRATDAFEAELAGKPAPANCRT